MVATVAIAPLPAVDATVQVSVDPTSGRAAISPLIYGSNQEIPGARLTLRRQGGNRMTGYNWENNASSAGADWFHSSDDFLTWVVGIPANQAATPAIVVADFHDNARAGGADYTIVTLPMAGFVAADKNGVVTPAQAAPSARWVAVQHTKPGAFSALPALDDGVVYTDELLHVLLARYGSAASATGIKAYSLDNEPDLWAHTHPRIHPAPTTGAGLVTRTVELARAIKRMDPAAETYGFASYGFNGYLTLQDAPDWPALQAASNGAYQWYLDYFLDQLRLAGIAEDRRLLDVVDLHNYSEHVAGGERVNAPATWENIECNRGRLQAPRSWWDPTFVESSWIGQHFPSFLPLLPRMRQSIDAFYPGTKLAITEYNFGGESHVSGGLAQADALGILGRQGVYAAAFWQLHDNPDYIAAAFNLFRDYDGLGGTFGDTAVAVTNSDHAVASVFAAVDAIDDGRLHLIVLNKNHDGPTTATITLAGDRAYASARVFAFDGSSPAITERAPVGIITDNAFTLTLPALTAAHVVLAADPPPPAFRQQPISQAVNTGGAVTLFAECDDPAAGLQWFRDGAAISGATASLLQLENLQPADSGVYTVAATNLAGTTTSRAAAIVVGTLSGRLANLSTRGEVRIGDEIMIAGFVITGGAARTVLIRAVGPGLVPHGIDPTAALADPRLTVFAGADPIVANDDWSMPTSGGPPVAPVAQAVSAFELPVGSPDAALVATLAPGLYTVHVSGADGGTGIALVELYDTEPAGGASRLVNLSTRGRVSTGNAIMIPGLVVGDAGRRLLVRGVGPGLAGSGLSPLLPDPVIRVVDRDGNEIVANDDWGSAATSPEIVHASQVAQAFPLADDSTDAALVVTLPPGVFTALVADKHDASGIALVEVYELP